MQTDRSLPYIRLSPRSIWIGLSAGMLAGCASGPDFKPPAAPDVAGYTATALPAQTVAAPTALGGTQRFVAGAPIAAEWWRQFGLAKLDALIEAALRASPTLEAAEATLRQARQNYEAKAGTTQYPQANANLGAQRQGVNNAAAGLPGGERTYNLFNASVAVSYDLDLAGGNRRALEALAAQTEYQRHQLEAARLTLIGNLVTTAIAQAQLAGQIEASAAILAAQEEQLVLTRKRLELGAASDRDVLALQTQVEQTRAGLPPLRQRLEQNQHLLATLAGQPPGSAAPQGVLPHFNLADFSLPGELPVSLPSELTRQRPDIQAAEALLAAASAQRGVAVSRLYPRIALNANLGAQALTAASLFDGGSLAWGLAGQLAQPLFNRGLRAEVGAAEAGFDAAAAHYRQTVLQALREVADVLRALDHDAQALASHAAADSAARESLRLTQQHYDLGAASYLELLIAQQQAQQTRISLVAAQASRLADTAALYQAMGGGWSRDLPADQQAQPEHKGNHQKSDATPS
uniref:RND efflux system outer membrane lipoprotein NodT family n=1 Tax=uncultured microorganism TaxID=358574 RepID=F8UHU7_9ZZZZ|nr:RND efflux system outer membrane lipoprotein NodT family [uncultured microorganism]